MKKIISSFLVLIICLGITGCSSLDYDEMRKNIKNNDFTIELLDLSTDKLDADEFYSLRFTRNKSKSRDSHITLSVYYYNNELYNLNIHVGSDRHEESVHSFFYIKGEFKPFINDNILMYRNNHLKMYN